MFESYSIADINIAQREDYLVGFYLMCGCEHTFMYGEGKLKRHVFCSYFYLLTELIMFDNQSGSDWLHAFFRA